MWRKDLPGTDFEEGSAELAQYFSRILHSTNHIQFCNISAFDVSSFKKLIDMLPALAIDKLIFTLYANVSEFM